jgi:DNA invertase Pin-like site-specific DNA recombinase
MTGNVYSLIRVSTEDQNEERQVIRMIELGIPKENIVIEKESGKSTARTKYKGLVRKLKSGDTLYIENVDRLSRDYDGIISEWHKLAKQKGVTIKILDTPIIDTDHPAKDLLNRFIRNILLHIYAFLAELEWLKIKSRQAQGIAVAKAKGKNLGRPKTVITDEQREIIKRYQEQEISLDVALALLNKKKSAFYNLCRNITEPITKYGAD